MTRLVARRIRAALLALLVVAVAGCGGASSHIGTPPPVGTPAATPPGPSSAAVASARQPSVAATRGADWPTYHDVDARTGAVPEGPPLGQVRRLWSAPVDGAVYAEPLVVGGRVIVATNHDSVYAFDAASGARLWGVHLGTPVPGGVLPCGDIDPSGITSTPVVDVRSGALYVVMFKRGFRHELVALDVDTGAVLWERAIDPPGGDYETQQQRAALALSDGRVYVAYGGLFGDCGRYHGWVLGAPASGPNGPLVKYEVPAQNQAAIWSPSGPSVDTDGDLYVATGNGNSASFDYGNAVIRLTPTLREVSFFAPPNAGQLNLVDQDLGSTGPLLLPHSRVFIMGKNGIGYLLDASNLGGISDGLASINLHVPYFEGAYGGDAYADGTIYLPIARGLLALQVGSDSLRELWLQKAVTLPPIIAGPGLWGIGNGVLYQLDPATGAVRYRASIGQAANFSTPSASGGRIYVAADGRIYAFG
jgi:outer membrane protein assembly factor BamB